MTQQGDSTDDVEALIVGHTLSINSTGSWVVDLGATSHMCASQKRELQKPGEMTVGDGHLLNVLLCKSISPL